jgi:hypothetical protein
LAVRKAVSALRSAASKPCFEIWACRFLIVFGFFE